MKKVFTFVLTITLLLCSGWSSHFYFASDEKTIEIEPQLYMGYGYSGVLTKDGNLYMWGYNWCGQVGNGTTEDQHLPEKVLDNIVSAAVTFDVAESAMTGAIAEDGSLYMWGYNEDGSLGNGIATGIQTIPLKIMECKKNVSDLIQQIESAEEGETVEIELEDTTILSKEVLLAIQENGITLAVTLDNGISWRINSKNLISETFADIDLAVEKNENISSDGITSLTGDRVIETLAFAENGALAFPVQLINTVSVNTEKAVLIQYVNDSFKLVDKAFVSDETITFNLNEKADSVIVYGTNGDTNGDDSVTIKDMMQMLHHISNRSELNEVQKGFADVDMNGSVNLQDLMRELRYVSGRSDNLYEENMQ